MSLRCFIPLSALPSARGQTFFPRNESCLETSHKIMRRYLGSRETRISYGYLHQVKKHLNGFIKFLIANEVGSVYAVTERTLIKYREFLWEELLQTKETALVVRSQIDRLRRVVQLFRYLHKDGIFKDNPAQSMNGDCLWGLCRPRGRPRL